MSFRCEDCARKHDKCHHRFAPHGKRILVIPDTQLKPGVPMEHMTWAGKYAAEKRPDIIVHIGDAADMHSLSSYDKGKKSFEGRRYKADIAAAHHGMELFSNELAKENGYDPDMRLTYGNHCHRITRAVENQPELEGVISLDDLKFEELGWRTHPFLEIVELQGIEFSHYFATGPKLLAASTAAAIMRRRQTSAVAGHNQAFDMVVHPVTGKIAMMVGAFYQHQEDYLGPQGQAQRLQIVMLNEAKDGHFDPMLVSLNYLKRKYSVT